MSNYAFFDIDQTIYPGYSMSDFYLFLVTKGLGGEWTILKDKEIGDLYSSGKITYSDAGLRVSQLLAEVTKNHSVSEIAEFGKEFIRIRGLKGFVAPLFTILKKHRFHITLVSAAIDAIAEPIGKHAKADDYLTSASEVKGGKYTGKLLHQLDNEEKQKLIEKSINVVDKHTILAFGDSTGDIPMLSLANYAFVIDPHQPEMKDIVRSHDNWYLVNEQNILDQVQAVIENFSGSEK